MQYNHHMFRTSWPFRALARNEVCGPFAVHFLVLGAAVAAADEVRGLSLRRLGGNAVLGNATGIPGIFGNVKGGYIGEKLDNLYTHIYNTYNSYIYIYYIILYYIILYYTILYYIILYYIILYYAILYYIILFYIILYYIILYYTILYYTILYYIILYYIILYSIILYIYILIVTILWWYCMGIWC